MPKLVWDELADRIYETGLDRGVLYLPDGSAVSWNGLTSIIEQVNREVSPVYFDGMKITDFVVLGDFKATLKALTYPDEFLEIEGLGNPRSGMFLGDQRPKLFGLCYRTKIGNAIESDFIGYKIHIIYNVTAIPVDTTHVSVTDDPSLIEFEWNISAVPEQISGYSPTAHIIVDSTKTDPWLLEELEEKLYGSSLEDALLIPMSELVSFLRDWYRVKIIDNFDGTWTAITDRDGFISIDEDELFTIININAVYLDPDTYVISDTRDIFDVT